jgi:ATP synthase protein I
VIGGFVTGSEPRSPLSKGLELASTLSTLGFEFGLPPLLGHYLDQRLGSAPVGVLVGMILGFTIGIMHVLRVARDSTRSK